MEAIFEQLSETHPSEFLDLDGIEYFQFEEEFMENNMRCIPMIIRFKMDMAGIKLKLSEWKRFSTEERIELAFMNCGFNEGGEQYAGYLAGLIKKHTGRDPTTIEVNKTPPWKNLHSIPGILIEKLREFDWNLSIAQWGYLTDLQRFALLKLCRPGHENKNFPKAMKEFNLVN
jgi:hypothetical protein